VRRFYVLDYALAGETSPMGLRMAVKFLIALAGEPAIELG
jgi:hypothetical protein